MHISLALPDDWSVHVYPLVDERLDDTCTHDNMIRMALRVRDLLLTNWVIVADELLEEQIQDLLKESFADAWTPSQVDFEVEVCSDEDAREIGVWIEVNRRT